jgi:hypothetical protein
MEDCYIVKDTRLYDSFKDRTYSDYKKSEVFSILFKNIEQKNLEESCFWLAECILSGYILDIFEKMVLFSCKIIHINNPKLPSFLWNRCQTFYNSFSHINQKQKQEFLQLRNSQHIRNLLFDILTTIVMASKDKRYDKYPKIKDEDFNFQNIQGKLIASMNILPSELMKYGDPDELKIIMNEIFYNLKIIGGYEKSCYWLTWIIQWEKLNNKKGNWSIAERSIAGVKKQYCTDVVWLLWRVIFEEANTRNNHIKKEIQSLYNLFKYHYSSGKKNRRICIIYNAVGYLTNEIDFNIHLRKEHDLFIQVQCKSNKLFMNKTIKTSENQIIKKVDPIKSIESEKCNDKLDYFNHLVA